MQVPPLRFASVGMTRMLVLSGDDEVSLHRMTTAAGAKTGYFGQGDSADDDQGKLPEDVERRSDEHGPFHQEKAQPVSSQKHHSIR